MTQFVIQGLKTEIIEAAKSRIDLLKWKLIAIAALGSIGLGLKKEITIFAPQFTLCLIPLVCCYVDLLCKHLSLRVLVINKFVTISPKLDIKENEPLKLYQKYEDFCYELSKRDLQNVKNSDPKNRTFALEDLAQEWSTIICSILITIIGIILLLQEANNDLDLLKSLGFTLLENTKIYVIFSGLIGFFLTRMISLTYQKKLCGLEEFSEEYIIKKNNETLHGL